MQIELSRLEIKELLANLGPECEPEVRDKLTEALGFTTKTHVATPSVPVALDVRSPLTSLGELRDAVRQKALEAEEDIFRPLTRERDFPNTAPGATPITDEEIEAINVQRMDAGRQAAIGRAAREGRTIIDMAEIPVAPRSGHVAVGATNRVGDTCVKLNHAGQSVFQCKNGHGYIEEGSVTSGCPRCWAGASSGGDSEPQEARITMDVDNPNAETF